MEIQALHKLSEASHCIEVNIIDTLPIEIFQEIILHVDTRGLYAANEVCKKWHSETIQFAKYNSLPKIKKFARFITNNLPAKYSLEIDELLNIESAIDTFIPKNLSDVNETANFFNNKILNMFSGLPIKELKSLRCYYTLGIYLSTYSESTKKISYDFSLPLEPFPIGEILIELDEANKLSSYTPRLSKKKDRALLKISKKFTLIDNVDKAIDVIHSMNNCKIKVKALLRIPYLLMEQGKFNEAIMRANALTKIIRQNLPGKHLTNLKYNILYRICQFLRKEDSKIAIKAVNTFLYDSERILYTFKDKEFISASRISEKAMVRIFKDLTMNGQFNFAMNIANSVEKTHINPILEGISKGLLSMGNVDEALKVAYEISNDRLKARAIVKIIDYFLKNNSYNLQKAMELAHTLPETFPSDLSDEENQRYRVFHRITHLLAGFHDFNNALEWAQIYIKKYGEEIIREICDDLVIKRMFDEAIEIASTVTDSRLRAIILKVIEEQR